MRHGIFNKFKSNQLNIDLDIYKEARNQVQRLIKNKKKIFLRKTNKYNKTKTTLENAKISRTTEQKNSPTNIRVENGYSIIKFPDAYKIAKLKPFFKKVRKRILLTTIQTPFYHLRQKSWGGQFMNKLFKFLDIILYKFQSGFRNNHSTDFYLLI